MTEIKVVDKNMDFAANVVSGQKGKRRKSCLPPAEVIPVEDLKPIKSDQDLSVEIEQTKVVFSPFKWMKSLKSKKSFFKWFKLKRKRKENKSTLNSSILKRNNLMCAQTFQLSKVN